MKKTKILATIGPATLNEETFNEMRMKGLNAIRLNSVHSDEQKMRKAVRLAKKFGLTTLIDLEGPEPRIWSDKPMEVKKSREFIAGFCKGGIYFSKSFGALLKKGDKIFLNDGQLPLEVKKVQLPKLLLVAKKDGTIKPGKSVYIPALPIEKNYLSAKDKKTIQFALKEKVDFIGLSFVSNSNQVKQVKKLCGKKINLIAKIEEEDGVKNVDEIMDLVEGVMIARGDLGTRMKQEKVPFIQKQIIEKANRKGKIAIVATEMLESMICNPRPTRAETSDIANAILDGADCLMLSAETAIGKHPEKSVNAMACIALETETYLKPRLFRGKHSLEDLISEAVREITLSHKIDRVCTITRSGFTAQIISRFRIKPKIIALTDSEKVKNKLQLVFGVMPFVFKSNNGEKKIEEAAKYCLKRKIVTKSETVLFAAGIHTKEEKTSNLIEVSKISNVVFPK